MLRGSVPGLALTGVFNNNGGVPNSLSIMPEQAIPEFELPSTGGKIFKLSDYSEKILVIYFYPKDATPGCTTQGQQFRDLYPEFQTINAEIFGISRDSLKSHENFKAKFNFPFELLSDTQELACNLFGVVKMKNMYGKQVRGIERSTFLIDKGILVKEWRGVKADGHASAVLDFIKNS
jgi:thioredoxin-dependent peroxiredoxin